MTAPRRRSLKIAITGAALAALFGICPATAQSMSSNSASYNAGWGRASDQENRAVDPSTADINGNQVVINGQIMNGNSQSVFANGAASASAGVGAGSGAATAIGNNLTVITQGDNNVVVIDSKQINNGTITATQSGSVSANGP